jgi:hypothetical protein
MVGNSLHSTKQPYSSSNIIDRHSGTRNDCFDEISAILRPSFPRDVERGGGVLESETRSRLGTGYQKYETQEVFTGGSQEVSNPPSAE